MSLQAEQPVPSAIMLTLCHNNANTFVNNASIIANNVSIFGEGTVTKR